MLTSSSALVPSFAGVAVEVLESAELELDEDEQAVAARPRPIMAVRTLARLRGFTVLPSRKARALHVQLERSAQLISVPGRRHRPSVVPT